MFNKKIKKYCEYALEISHKKGCNEGLAFLIGEKLAKILFELKQTQNKLKFLYPEKYSLDNDSIPQRGRFLKLSYALTLDSHYKEYFTKIDSLKSVLETFVVEIRNHFDISDIHNYLNSHPRLGFKQKSLISEDSGINEDEQFSVDNVISEAEDIFLIQDIKKLFEK